MSTHAQQTNVTEPRQPTAESRRRPVIEGVYPEIDCGRFPIKRVVGERVTVEADIFTDGHDALGAVLRYRHASEQDWNEVRFEPLVNDRWRASFTVQELGRYRYMLVAWVDRFATWRRDLVKRVQAGQDVSTDLLIGAELIEQAIARAEAASDAEALRDVARRLRELDGGQERIELALSTELAEQMARHADFEHAAYYPHELQVVVDPVRAQFSTWYEVFPRSTGPVGRHGTFRDVEDWLPYIADMGFDVLYLPPIHPIGTTFRKGKNNAVVAEGGDPGSPWAIGSAEGGHKAIHPELGTLEDFRHLLATAHDQGLEVALDIAFQTSPNHPYVEQHPEWFRWRPDGTIQYAENPPKKYQDIYPFEFESEQWQSLWHELRSVVGYWIDQGVRIFRVDNPHTKPFAFWEWLIDTIKRDHPEIIFLSEAFTRPKVMYRLAKLGFSQSYTYFAWRNLNWELTQYLTELTQTEVSEYFRPNLWPNTPDILTEQLQTGNRSTFLARLVLAATLGASYGIYGPAFELLEHHPAEAGREEYLGSEKYEIRHWDRDRPESIQDFIAQVNQIRRQNPALQTNRTLRFHSTDNEQLIAYSKSTDDLDNVVLTVVNLDPYHRHSGWVTLPLDELGLDAQQPYQVHDLLTDERYTWSGSTNFVMIDPAHVPAHVFRVRRRLRSEHEFEYFM